MKFSRKWTWCSGNMPGFQPGVVGSTPTVRTVWRCEEEDYFDSKSVCSGFESRRVHFDGPVAQMAEQLFLLQLEVLAVRQATGVRQVERRLRNAVDEVRVLVVARQDVLVLHIACRSSPIGRGPRLR